MASPLALLGLIPLLPFLAAHPHHPKALIARGAAGATTVTYFTVPYNSDHLEGLQPGFEWHLGYAGLETEVSLKLAGEIDVPAGKYKLGVVRGASDAAWDLLLEPWALWRAKMNHARASQRGGDAVEQAAAALEAARAECAEREMPERITAPTGARKMPAAEHLEIEVGLRGYATTQRFGTEPAQGMEFELRMDFGGLHRVIEVQEVFVPKKDG